MNNKEWKIIATAAIAAIAIMSLALSLGACVGPPEPGEPIAAQSSGPDIAGAQLAAGQSVSTTIATVGGMVRTLGYDTLILWIDYEQGTETDVAVRARWHRTAVVTETEYADRTWTTTAGFRTLAAVDAYSMTASGYNYITYDVTGIPFALVYVQARGTVTTANQGTITVTYSAVAE